MLPRKGNALQNTLLGPYPVSFVDSMEAITSIKAVGDMENEQTYVVFSYAYQQGCRGIARDRTRLTIEEYGQNTLDELGDIILEDEICYIVYHFGKGHLLDQARNHAVQMAEARKWKRIFLMQKRSLQSRLSRALFGWGFTVESQKSSAESERLLGICHELSMQVPDPASPSPLVLIEQLCGLHLDLDRIFSDAITTSTDPDPYFVACSRVADELDKRRQAYLEQEVKKKLRLEHLKKAKEADHRARVRKKDAYKAILYKSSPKPPLADARSSQSTSRSAVPDSSRGPGSLSRIPPPPPLGDTDADSSVAAGSPRLEDIGESESGSDRIPSRASSAASSRPPPAAAAGVGGLDARSAAAATALARAEEALNGVGGGAPASAGELSLLLIEARAALGRDKSSNLDERIHALEEAIRQREEAMVDESLSAEDDFQRQLENDARLLSLQMEAACTRIQAQARGYIVRRVHRTLRRLQYPGWTDAQLAALRVSAVAIVVWLPPPAAAAAAAAAASLRDMTGHHVRRIAEALEGPDSAGRSAPCAYITHRAQALGDLSRVSLAQAVAEVYGLDRAARRGRRGGRDEDEDPLGRDPVHFPAYGAYLELVERYADVFGRGPDSGGVDKGGTARFSGGGGGLAGEGGAGAELSSVSATLYFEKHHYRVLSRAEALAARVRYDGHVRALSSSGGPRPAVVGAEAAAEQGLPQVQCECAPWFTLRFPRTKSVRNADAAAVNAAAAAAEAKHEDSSYSIARSLDGLRSARKGRSAGDWPPSDRPSDLPAHFRFFQDGVGSGARAAAGAGVGELLRKMFRAKCKDLGIKPIAEQEAGFIERAQKGLSEEHFRLSDLGVGAAVVPQLTEVLSAPECLVTWLDLSNNPLRDAGGAALARLLPRCSELLRLELRSVGLGDAGVAALFEGMRKDSLTRLDLGCAGTFGRNSLGVLGAEAAAKLLAQTSNLSWLSLASTGVTPECATLLSKGLRQNLTLRVLDLSENQVSDAGASNILTAAISADLRELNLGHNEISDRSAPHFLALLDSVRVSLEKLDLRGNKISNHASAAIAMSLSMKNTSLSTLLLDGNELGPLGAASLAKGLTMEEKCTLDSGMKVEIQMKYPRSLTTLRLSQNELKDEGASTLCSILTKNWTLTALDLSNNMITDAGARAVGKSILKNTSLVNLSLSWNLIGDAGIDALAQNFRAHEYLHSLSIEANKFSEKGGAAIVDMLSTCTSICSLKFDFNEVTYNHSEAIKSLLDRNAKMMESNYTVKMKNEISFLSQKQDQFPDLEAKLKSEERALKNRNDAIKDLKSKMLESRAAVAKKISEFDEKQSVVGERLKQIALNMKNADLKIRLQGESTAVAVQSLQTNIRRGRVKIEDLLKQLHQLRTIAARQDSEYDTSIARREKNLADQKAIERDCLLEKSKALKMLRIFLQCNENIFDPEKHQHAWKLVSSHARRRPSTVFQTVVTDVLMGLTSNESQKRPFTGTQTRAVQKSMSKSNFESVRKRDGKKLSYVDSELLTSGTMNNSIAGRRIQRQETKKSLPSPLSRTGSDPSSKLPINHRHMHQGNETISGKSETFDKSKDSWQDVTSAGSDSSNIATAQSALLDTQFARPSETPAMVHLQSVGRIGSTPDYTGGTQPIKQDDRNLMSKEESGENGRKIPKIKIKVPVLRLDGRISPKVMLRSSDADARPESKFSREDSRNQLASVQIRRSEDIRSNNSFNVKLPQMPTAADAQSRKAVKEFEAVLESPPNMMELITKTIVRIGEKPDDVSVAKPVDVFDSILEAESFIKSAEKASVAFSAVPDSSLVDFNDAEFDLGKVERMMNMHKMRVNRSRDEQLKLLDALSSEFQGFD